MEDIQQCIPPRHSWFADATLPRLPAPYFWNWCDRDLNITFNHNNIHKADGTEPDYSRGSASYKDEGVAYITPLLCVWYMGIGPNQRKNLGEFSDIQTAINTLYTRLCLGEWA